MSIGHLLTFPTLAMRLLAAHYMVRRSAPKEASHRLLRALAVFNGKFELINDTEGGSFCKG